MYSDTHMYEELFQSVFSLLYEKKEHTFVLSEGPEVIEYDEIVLKVAEGPTIIY